MRPLHPEDLVYWAGWLVISPVFFTAFYFVVRYAVRWGVEHGMERFVSKDPK
jgi:hypothetical protein